MEKCSGETMPGEDMSRFHTMLDYLRSFSKINNLHLLRATTRMAPTSKNVRVEKKIQMESDFVLNIYFQIFNLLLFASLSC